MSPKASFRSHLIQLYMECRELTLVDDQTSCFIDDLEAVEHLRKVRGLVYRGLEPAPEKVTISRCEDCRRRTYRTDWRGTVICAACEERRYRNEIRKEKRRRRKPKPAPIPAPLPPPELLAPDWNL